jgi:hypothetical protein
VKQLTQRSKKAEGNTTARLSGIISRYRFRPVVKRCLAWIEEPIVYDNLEGYARLTADLKTPVQIGENFYGPRALYTALQMKACDYVMPDFMADRRRDRLAASGRYRPQRQALRFPPIFIPRWPPT